MTCHGQVGDYLCVGWTKLRDRIRARDGNRCRGCNRTEGEVRLEVHHRIYGSSGHCGDCTLCGVDDEDLCTLCVDCHDSITDVRRRVRYGTQAVDIDMVEEPKPIRAVISVKTEVAVGEYENPSKRRSVVRRTVTDILG